MRAIRKVKPVIATHVIRGDAAHLPLPDTSIDAIVTDPPYEISFMLRKWDSSGIAYDSKVWDEAFRVLKPGGYLLAFGGTRTSHRLTCAIEDAGFEIRDSITWIYGSGMPKSLDVSKAIDKAAGAKREIIGKTNHCIGPSQAAGYIGSSTFREPNWKISNDLTAPATDAARQWDGWGTALKPAHEPIVVARKPLVGTVAANVITHGTGAMNIDGCRINAKESLVRPAISRQNNTVLGKGLGVGTQIQPSGRWPSNVVFSHTPECKEIGTREIRGDKRSGGDGTRIGGFGDVRGKTDGNGRPVGKLYGDENGMETVPAWECTEDCPVAELDRQSGKLKSGALNRANITAPNLTYGTAPKERVGTYEPNEGGASRFFPVFRYQAKAPASERPTAPDGTKHSTVKPLGLMRHLVRLVTPPGGTVLDMFAGSGTTGEAAALEGFNCILIEKEDSYLPMIQQRIARSRKDVA